MNAACCLANNGRTSMGDPSQDMSVIASLHGWSMIVRKVRSGHDDVIDGPQRSRKYWMILSACSWLISTSSSAKSPRSHSAITGVALRRHTRPHMRYPRDRQSRLWSYGAALVGPSLVVRVERRPALTRHLLRGLCEPDLLEATDF